MQEMNGGLRMVNLGIVQPCGENKENGGDGENEKRTGRTRRSGENEKDYSFRGQPLHLLTLALPSLPVHGNLFSHAL